MGSMGIVSAIVQSSMAEMRKFSCRPNKLSKTAPAQCTPGSAQTWDTPGVPAVCAAESAQPCRLLWNETNGAMGSLGRPGIGHCTIPCQEREGG